jgi:hypothetical protein
MRLTDYILTTGFHCMRNALCALNKSSSSLHSKAIQLGAEMLELENELTTDIAEVEKFKSLVRYKKFEELPDTAGWDNFHLCLCYTGQIRAICPDGKITASAIEQLKRYMDTFGTFMLPQFARVKCCKLMEARAQMQQVDLSPFQVIDLIEDVVSGCVGPVFDQLVHRFP